MLMSSTKSRSSRQVPFNQAICFVLSMPFFIVQSVDMPDSNRVKMHLCFTSVCKWNPFWCLVVLPERVLCIFVYHLDDDFSWNSVKLREVPQYRSMQTVKCLLRIDEIHAEGNLPVYSLFCQGGVGWSLSGLYIVSWGWIEPIVFFMLWIHCLFHLT